jgi:predicted  nucleic acid-binding Zn-ribbon protein
VPDGWLIFPLTGGVVNEELRVLIELQKLDSSIISFDQTIRAIPGKISTMEKPLKEARLNLEKRKKALEEANNQKKGKDDELEEANYRIEKLKDRTSEIKDNKSYHAHLVEIEKAEKKHYDIEDEILSIMETIEEESKGQKEAEEALDRENTKAKELRRQLDEEVREAESQLQVLKDKRAGFVSALGRETYDQYMDTLTMLEGLAVTEAANEVCKGCNMGIMPQLFVEIKKNDSIIMCPQCKRILYFNESQELDGRTREISEHIGLATNNIAEYSAMIRGLEEALRHGADDVTAYLDSELVVKQIRGQYKVRNKGLMPYYKKAVRLIGRLRTFSIEHVPRESNTVADRLSKQGANNRPPVDSSSHNGNTQSRLPF